MFVCRPDPSNPREAAPAVVVVSIPVPLYASVTRPLQAHIP